MALQLLPAQKHLRASSPVGIYLTKLAILRYYSEREKDYIFIGQRVSDLAHRLIYTSDQKKSKAVIQQGAYAV